MVVNADVDRIKRIIGNVSNVAVKQWLKNAGKHHAAQNEGSFLKLIAKMIDKGEMSFETLEQIVLEIEENGGKQIFLREIGDVEKLRSKEYFEAHLGGIGLKTNDSKDISVRQPTGSVLNYVWWSEVEIRIKYSEIQIRKQPNYETGVMIVQNEIKYAVAILDTSSGLVQIRLDPPATVHAYKDPVTNKSRKSLYEAHYFQVFSNILDNCKFEMIDLYQSAEHLVKTNPRIFRIPMDTGLAGDNARYRFTHKDDVRDIDAYKGAANADQDMMPEKISGYWRPDQSNDRISREVYMHLDSKAGMISFLADCLKEEVDYAINRIREI